MADEILFRWRRDLIAEATLDAAAKHTGLTLALYMNVHGGEAFPSITRLARETSRKRATVIAAVNRLEEAGWLHVRRGFFAGANGGKTEPSRYQARFPKGHLADAYADTSAGAPTGTSGNGDGRYPNGHQTGVYRGTEQVPEGAPEVLITSRGPASTPAELAGLVLQEHPLLIANLAAKYAGRDDDAAHDAIIDALCAALDPLTPETANDHWYSGTIDELRARLEASAQPPETT